MKIVVSSLTYPLPNGVTASINTSCDGFIKRGHQIMIISPDYGMKKFRKEHFPVSSSTLGKLFLSIFGKEERMFGANAQEEIERLIEEFQPDAFWLHTVTWAQNAFEKVMTSSTKAKVLSYHTMVEYYGRIYGGYLGAAAMVRRSRQLGNAVDRIITPSQMMASRLRSYGVTTPIIPIFTAVSEPAKEPFNKEELAKRFGFSSKKPLLLYIGRISKEKNISALLIMAQEIKAMGEDFVLLLLGPGDLEQTRKEVANLSLGDKVVIAGALPTKEEAQRCYGGADVFVFASQSETQGLVVSEAMISSVAVAALKSPVQREVYPQEVALIANDEKELASQVVKLIKNPSLRRELANKGREFVLKNFNYQTMLDKQIGVFEELVG